jgi:hypothetical protein
MAPQAAQMGHPHLGRDDAGHRIAQGHHLRPLVPHREPDRLQAQDRL